MKERTDEAIYPRRASSGHVPLHVLWASAKGRGQLGGSEQDHVVACNECSVALQLCGQAQNFGAVLKEMRRAPAAAGSAADGKPKLKTLYILQGDTARRRTD
jgi:hypothetical protein